MKSGSPAQPGVGQPRGGADRAFTLTNRWQVAQPAATEALVVKSEKSPPRYSSSRSPQSGHAAAIVEPTSGTSFQHGERLATGCSVPLVVGIPGDQGRARPLLDLEYCWQGSSQS